MQRIDDLSISVVGDEKYRQRRDVHRNGEPGEDGTTERLPEEPVVRQLVVELERKVEGTETDVREGKACDEDARRRLKIAVTNDDGEDDDTVAEYTRQDHERI